jgi:sodium/hydrogen antiporter
MESATFALIAASIIAVGLVSRRLQRSVLSLPMVFMAIGLATGHHYLGWLDLHIDSEAIHILAELTLVLVLFTDASRIDLALLRREHSLPVRLLAIGLPLCILLGTAVGATFLGSMGFWSVVVLAVILAPTDAALGQAVVSSDLVPTRIRQALNVESGLNDGIVLPVLLIVLCMADPASQTQGAGFWVNFVALQLILGPLVGIAVGFLGGRLVQWGARAQWMDHPFQELSVIGLSLLAFAGAEQVGGNGFIAAFVAGLTLGNTSRAVCTCLLEFGEAEGQLLTLLVFMVFGAVLVPPALEHFQAVHLLYGLLSLTLVRMLPAALSLAGKGLRPPTLLFIGWFGPRGLASILFALLVLEKSQVAEREEIMTIVVLTVLMSIVAHGATAYPGTKWYAKKIKGDPTKSGKITNNQEMKAVEGQPVSEMPVRLPHRS